MSLAQKLVLTVVVIGALLMLAGLSAPVILKSRKAPDRTEALNNIKQISTMLLDFEKDYGRFPDNETALEVKRKTGTGLSPLSGQYSNDYFRQLLAGGGGKSEKPFWCKTAQSPKKNSADDFSTPAKALEAGEVGFSYIMASQTRGQASSDEPNRPVIVTPSYRFQADWSFDPEVYAGKAIVLRLDGSAIPVQIREDDKKVGTGTAGKTLGDVGDLSVWGTDMNPVMKAPQAR